MATNPRPKLLNPVVTDSYIIFSSIFPRYLPITKHRGFPKIKYIPHPLNPLHPFNLSQTIIIFGQVPYNNVGTSQHAVCL